MSKFWKGVGKVIGQTGGFAFGIVGGVIEGAGEVIKNGDWNAAGEKMNKIVENAVEEGGKFGEDALPEVAQKVAASVAAGIVLHQAYKNTKQPPKKLN